jgi:hypothetical protein
MVGESMVLCAVCKNELMDDEDSKDGVCRSCLAETLWGEFDTLTRYDMLEWIWGAFGEEIDKVVNGWDAERIDANLMLFKQIKEQRKHNPAPKEAQDGIRR